MGRNIILVDEPDIQANLLPISFTRPVSHIQCGLLTARQRWQRIFPEATISHSTTDYLAPLHPEVKSDEGNLFIMSHFLPTNDMAKAVSSLLPGQRLTTPEDELIAHYDNGGTAETVVIDKPITSIRRLYDIFELCGNEIERDFKTLTAGRKSAPLSSSCTLIGNPGNLFIEEGAIVEGAIINVNAGPIYIGRDAEVMEGACLRGPIGVLENAHVNMGARIYGPTVIGQWCKVGGELNNVVMHPYSNKAHDGFLGNSVIGSWCNLGAGCTASNLKNDYSEIKLWNYPSRRFLRTGRQFCGLIMADHSKAGINTMFNTATVVGVGCNIHGTGFPRNFVASFSEGSPSVGFSDVSMTAFRRTAERVMQRRGLMFTDADRQLFESIRAIAESYK